MVMDSIREGVKKPWAKILIFAIVISFVGAGYFTSTLFLGDPNAVAEVNGDSISRQEFDRAYSRARQQYGEAFKQLINTPEQEKNFEENVFQSLISKKVILQMAEQQGMRISTTHLRKTIQEMDALQNEAGYSSDLLDQALANLRMSRSQFKKSMQEDLLLQQLSAGISNTEFVLPSEAQNDYKIMGQLRTGRVLPIKYSLFDAGLEIGDEAIDAYYQENAELFRIEEKVTLNYIELSAEQLQTGVKVTDEQITEYYDNNLERYQSDEQKRVSHLLVAIDDDTDEAAALAKAQTIKSRIDAGEDFAALVKTESSDEFSAESDGDLGVIEKGVMESSFDQALATLTKVGDISTPVKTSAGYHIIKLTELVASETQTLEQVKNQIVAEVKKQQALELFNSKFKILEEKAFEISDSLTEVAEQIEVDVKTSPSFGRQTPFGIFANPEVQASAFSEDVLEAELNSKLINLGDNHVIVLRLKQHQPSEVQPLEKVKDKIVANLKSQKAKSLAIELGDSIKSKLDKGESVEAMLAAKKLIWKDLDKVQRTSAVLPYLQLQSFFKMTRPSSASAKVIETMQDSNEYLVLVLNRVEDGDYKKAEKTLMTQTEQRLNRFYGQADYISLAEQQQSEASVTRNEQNIRP